MTVHNRSVVTAMLVTLDPEQGWGIDMPLPNQRTIDRAMAAEQRVSECEDLYARPVTIGGIRLNWRVGRRRISLVIYNGLEEMELQEIPFGSKLADVMVYYSDNLDDLVAPG